MTADSLTMGTFTVPVVTFPVFDQARYEASERARRIFERYYEWKYLHSAWHGEQGSQLGTVN